MPLGTYGVKTILGGIRNPRPRAPGAKYVACLFGYAVFSRCSMWSAMSVLISSSTRCSPMDSRLPAQGHVCDDCGSIDIKKLSTSTHCASVGRKLLLPVSSATAKRSTTERPAQQRQETCIVPTALIDRHHQEGESGDLIVIFAAGEWVGNEG